MDAFEFAGRFDKLDFKGNKEMMKKVCFVGGFSNGGTEKATFLIANMLCGANEVYLINIDDYKPAFHIDKRVQFFHISKKKSFAFHILKIYEILYHNNILKCSF